MLPLMIKDDEFRLIESISPGSFNVRLTNDTLEALKLGFTDSYEIKPVKVINDNIIYTGSFKGCTSVHINKPPGKIVRATADFIEPNIIGRLITLKRIRGCNWKGEVSRLYPSCIRKWISYRFLKRVGFIK